MNSDVDTKDRMCSDSTGYGWKVRNQVLSQAKCPRKPVTSFGKGGVRIQPTTPYSYPLRSSSGESEAEKKGDI